MWYRFNGFLLRGLTMFLRFSALVIALLGQVYSLRAEEKHIDAPDEKTFIVDQAGLLSKADAAKVAEIGRKLLADTQVHLVLITVKSMSEFGNTNNIETFARKFLDEWIKAQPDKAWTKAALLVRAAGDHKVHIQLGGAWHHTQDKECQEIMLQTIAPKFMANDQSGGLADGAGALAKLLTKNIAASNAEAEGK
jgi:uncharacterized membrane protein YgcG